MKTFILSTLVALSALASTANAGLLIDATKGPIQIVVDGNR